MFMADGIMIRSPAGIPGIALNGNMDENVRPHMDSGLHG
jgi:hypothetical protein